MNECIHLAVRAGPFVPLLDRVVSSRLSVCVTIVVVVVTTTTVLLLLLGVARTRTARPHE